VIDRFQKQRNFIGVIELRAVDYLGKPVVRITNVINSKENGTLRTPAV